jgi:hypothetical protein
MKKGAADHVFNEAERKFWQDYLRDDKVPGKGKEYRSYGKSYKIWLFSHESFVTIFTNWF